MNKTKTYDPNKTYMVSEIDGINALEDGRMLIFFKNGDEIETDSVDFLPDGSIGFGYIY